MNFSNKNVTHVKSEIDYIYFNKLREYSDILMHAFTVDTNYSFRTDKFNSHNLLTEEEYQKSINNYKILCNNLKIDYKNIVKVNQEHTSNIVVIDSKINIDTPDINIEKYKNIDGMITNKKGIALTTVSADCIILFMFDPVKKVIANVHSGWRGSLEAIGVRAIDIMQKQFNCNLEDIIITFNPSILGDCFLVDKDVKNSFYEKYSYLSRIDDIIKYANKKWLIDTVLLNKELFIEKGIKKDNIILSNICTMCNKKYIHSYRGSNGFCGLNTGIIMLK